MDIKTLENTPAWEWPDNADDIILNVLRNPGAEASDRLVAAKLAGDYSVINEELAAELLSILTNKGEGDELRSWAAISFGPALENADMMGFDDPDDIILSEKTCEKVQKTLRKIYMDSDTSKDLRRRVLEASVRAPEDWHREAVAAAYRDKDEDWKLTAVFCMGYVSGFEKQIVESLKSDNTEIELHAVEAAGVWEIDKAWKHISSLVKSKNTEKNLLLAAIESAAFIRPEDAEALLSPLLESDDQDIVDAVNEALSMNDEDYEDDDF